MSGDYSLHLVESYDDAQAFLRWLGESRDWLGCDTETEGLVWGKHRVRLVQFGDNRAGWAIPFERGGWGGLVQDTFNRYKGKYVFHNAKFDMGRLQADGVTIPPWRQINDTFVMSFLHDNQEPSKKLKRLAKKYVGIDADKGERELHEFFRKTGLFWDTVPITTPVYWQYAALDASITAMLAEKLWNDARSFPRAYDLEMAAIEVLMDMETVGVAIDHDYTEKTFRELTAERNSIMDKRDVVGQPKGQWYLTEENLRPNYTQEIISYFVDRKVHIPIKTSKKTGKLSIDDEVLSQMDHPMAKKIQRARHLNSWIDNYLDKLLQNEYEGKVHPHINPLGGDDKGLTGRMSITDPALGVLEKSRLIRSCIVAEEGNDLYEIDYKNQELRLIASLCNCRNMIDAFENNLDMHKRLASRIYGIPIEDVDPKQKTNAKRASFTAAYGGQAKTFSRYMGMSLEEGFRYFETLKSEYPEMFEYIEMQKQTIKANKIDGYGYIMMSDGRRLNVPAEQSFRAVSYSSQGEAAIVLKKKLVALKAAGFGPYLRIPIHDCNIFSVPEGEEGAQIIKEAAEVMYCTDYRVPLDVEITGPAKAWGEWYE